MTKSAPPSLLCLLRISHQEAVKIDQYAAASGPLPLPVVLRGREDREHLGSFA